MDWFIYIIETVDNTLYTGITKDVEKRYDEHCHGKQGAKYLKAHPPKKLVYTEKSENRSAATKREIEIKKMTRKEKLKLIKNGK